MIIGFFFFPKELLRTTMTEKFMSESGASVITGDNDPWTQQEQGTLTSVEDRAEKKKGNATVIFMWP